MEKNNEVKPRGPFFNGFLIGIVVGIIIALLFTTKKGKKLVRLITEEGLEGISELEGIIEEKVEESGLHKDNSSESLNGESNKQTAFSKLKATGKRFFKGIPKKN